LVGKGEANRNCGVKRPPPIFPVDENGATQDWGKVVTLISTEGKTRRDRKQPGVYRARETQSADKNKSNKKGRERRPVNMVVRFLDKTSKNTS